MTSVCRQHVTIKMLMKLMPVLQKCPMAATAHYPHTEFAVQPEPTRPITQALSAQLKWMCVQGQATWIGVDLSGWHIDSTCGSGLVGPNGAKGCSAVSHPTTSWSVNLGRRRIRRPCRFRLKWGDVTHIWL